MSPIRRSLQLVDSLSNLGRIKVGFATSDRVHVDQHFGSAVSLVAFSLDAEGAQLVSIGQFGELAEDGNEGKLAAKLQWLRGCVAVYCCACGGSAVRQL
ncbi:MAG: NifB/NifX family molybdenum-iron cluster-binding protein, partial [Pseudomonadota bacterium]|nr:NifB/NifX family molybdenum-iron cluster-binding protein [Pseudomonadota bacterium]